MLTTHRIGLTVAVAAALLAGPAADVGTAQVGRRSTAPAQIPDSVSASSADTTGVADVLGARPDERERRQLKATLGRISRDEVEGKSEWERRKNPRVALLSSTLVPGMGQVYNGRRLKVAVMLGFVAYYGGNMVLNWKEHKYHEARRNRLRPNTNAWRNEDILSEYHEETAVDFLWWSGAVWLIGLLDAWIDAHLYDIRSYSPQTPGAGDLSAGPPAGGGSGAERARYVTLTIGF